MKYPSTTKAQFHRWHISRQDWEDAVKYAKAAEKTRMDQLAYDALIQMAIICYWRTFSPNEKSKTAQAVPQIRIEELRHRLRGL